MCTQKGEREQNAARASEACKLKGNNRASRRRGVASGERNEAATAAAAGRLEVHVLARVNRSPPM